MCTFSYSLPSFNNGQNAVLLSSRQEKNERFVRNVKKKHSVACVFSIRNNLAAYVLHMHVCDQSIRRSSNQWHNEFLSYKTVSEKYNFKFIKRISEYDKSINSNYRK